MTEKIGDFCGMSGFTTEEPTMQLRFVSGRLQQLFSVKHYEDGKVVSVCKHWRDVPDETPATRPAQTEGDAE